MLQTSVLREETGLSMMVVICNLACVGLASIGDQKIATAADKDIHIHLDAAGGLRLGVLQRKYFS